MSVTSLDAMWAKLEGNADLQKAHEMLDNTRFDTVCQTMTRIESAIVDHAKTSADTLDKMNVRTHDTLDKMNVRTHARMDQIVMSISKLTDNVGALKDDVNELKTSMVSGDSAVKEDLHKRISSNKDWIIGCAIAVALPLMGWMALQLYEGLK